MHKRSGSEQADPRYSGIGTFATFRGTDGDDNLVGTDKDDIFNPLLGHDMVDGGGGHDLLNLNYRSIDGRPYGIGFVATLMQNGDSYSGSIEFGSTPNTSGGSTDFTNIEEIDCQGPASRPYHYLALDIQNLKAATIGIDGNALSVNDACTFSAFDFYALTLGASANVFDGGAPMAYLTALGTQDVIDGRGFHMTSLAYNLVGSSKDVTLDIHDGNGTITGGGHFTDVNCTAFYGGTGNNTVSTDSIMNVAGNRGRDMLDIDWTARTAAASGYIDYNFKSNKFSANILDSGTGLHFYIDSFTKGQDSISFTCGSGNDAISVTALANGITLDGGAGMDTLGIFVPGHNTGHPFRDPVVVIVDGTHVSLQAGGSFDNFEAIHVSGGPGDDIFSGFNTPSSSGLFDRFLGYDGFDTVTYENAAAGVTVSLAKTDNQQTGGAGTDQLQSIEGLIGSKFDDVLTGGPAGGSLDGGAGNDELHAGAIPKGAHATTMTGGTGADRFVFGEIADFSSASTLNRITDFSHRDHDKIDLARIDADPKVAGDQAFQYIGTAAFDADPGRSELRIEQATNGDWLVQADLNHDGTADFAFLVHATQPLVAGDFVL